MNAIVKFVKVTLLCCLLSVSGAPLADWPYRSMKIECHRDRIEIIDYSTWNEEGKARLAEPGVIDVDKLSTWRQTADGLNLPDKPLPHHRLCKLGAHAYSITITNRSTGGFSPPLPVVSITDRTQANRPRRLYDECVLTEMPQGETKFILSAQYPDGIFMAGGRLVPPHDHADQAACTGYANQ